MTEDTKKQPSTFWLKSVIGVLLLAIGFICGLWTACSMKPKPPEGALIYERSLDGRVVNLWIKGINGIAQKIEYKEVKPDTEYLLDTVYFPRDTISHYAITSVTLLPNPLTSFIHSRDTLGYARETQFLTSPNMLGGTYDIRIDTTGKVTWYEVPIDLRPKVKRTILSVILSGGVQYGQVDTLWKFSPEFGAGVEWTPFKTDWFALYAGLAYPPKAEIETRFKIPVLTKE